jgi:hypothetical protein
LISFRKRRSCESWHHKWWRICRLPKLAKNDSLAINVDSYYKYFYLHKIKAN